MSAASDAPDDERSSRRLSVGPGVPLVLQVSLIEPGMDEFFYDPYANLEYDDFAAACVFFIHHGHVVVFHDCPDAIAFQELFPEVNIQYISSLPPGLLEEGHALLTSQRGLLRSATGGRPPHITPPWSLADRYLTEHARTSRGSPPASSSSTSGSSTSMSSVAIHRPPLTFKFCHNASRSSFFFLPPSGS